MSLRFHGDALVAPGMLDFAVNVWPGERPEPLRDALAAALETTGYPDERAALQAVADAWDRDPDEVLLTNGACEAFWLLAHTVKPAVAACVHPSFTEPEAAFAAVGAQIARVQLALPGWQLEPGAVPANADVVVLGNPNNPTGTLSGRTDVLGLRRPGRLVVVDESFMDFVPGQAESCAGIAGAGLVVVRSLTKLWGIAGLRAGYLLGDRELVARVAAQRQPWSVNALACTAIETCARDRRTPASVAAAVDAAREELLAELEALPGVEAWPSAANFVLVRLPDATAIVAELRRQGIAVRPCDDFPGLDESFVRVAVRPPEDSRVLVRALAEALATL